MTGHGGSRLTLAAKIAFSSGRRLSLAAAFLRPIIIGGRRPPSPQRWRRSAPAPPRMSRSPPWFSRPTELRAVANVASTADEALAKGTSTADASAAMVASRAEEAMP